MTLLLSSLLVTMSFQNFEGQSGQGLAASRGSHTVYFTDAEPALAKRFAFVSFATLTLPNAQGARCKCNYWELESIAMRWVVLSEDAKELTFFDHGVMSGPCVLPK